MSGWGVGHSLQIELEADSTASAVDAHLRQSL